MLYPILYADGVIIHYQIFGIRSDGKCVKYIDMGTLLEQYFGEKGITGISCHKLITNGDTIIAPLVPHYSKTGKPIGEFVFRWDKKAQWFSVQLNRY